MSFDTYAPADPASSSWFDDPLRALIHAAVWLVVVALLVGAALMYWQGRSPETYEVFVAGPLRRRRWRRWAHGTWERLAKGCGLSISEQVTRSGEDGRPVTTTVWTHPALLQVRTTGDCLYLTVRTRMGLTVQDLERAVPAIGDAAGAHSARSVVVAPGTVRIELVMREQLAATSSPAAAPTAVAVHAVTLGRCENGSPWRLTIAGRHTLTVGCSGPVKVRCAGASRARWHRQRGRVWCGWWASTSNTASNYLSVLRCSTRSPPPKPTR